MRYHRISDAEYARFKEVLAQHTTVTSAARELGIPKDQFCKFFTRRGEKASDFVIKPGWASPKDESVDIDVTDLEDTPPRIHPVIAAEQKEARKQERDDFKALVDELREMRTRHSFLDALGHAEPVLPRLARNDATREMCAVVLASDWHVEERVVDLAPFDAYTLDIAEDRVNRFFAGIRDLIDHHRASGKVMIDYLVLALLGDFMTGYIHEDCRAMSQLSPTETMLWLMPRLEGGIRQLIDDLDLQQVEIPCSFGNHGRSNPGKPLVAAAAENSYEWLMYNILAERMKDETRVHFEITKSAHQYIKVYDYVLEFHHGDHINYQGGILGPGVPVMKAVNAWRRSKHSDYTHIGHYHTYYDFRTAVMNGSLIGFSPYAMKVKADKEPPMQAFYLLDSKRGKCHSTGIWVAKNESESETT